MNNTNKIIDYNALFESALKRKCGVMWKDSVSYYIHNCPEETLKLYKQLYMGTYIERPAKYFTIHEPKEREIMSIAFRDRVYQGLFYDKILYPKATKKLIRDNCACQIGKGTDFAISELKNHLRKFYRKHGNKGYVLQCDIKSYFGSILHESVFEEYKDILEVDEYIMFKNMIKCFPGICGYNPGSPIVQAIGMTFLDDLDHYIKETLRIKHYIRYVDDIIILTESEDEAKRISELITLFVKDKKLSMHPKKTKIYKINKEIKFLGFNFILTNSGKVLTFLCSENIKKFTKGCKRLAKKVHRGEVSRKTYNKHYQCWRSYASKGSSKQLIYRMDRYTKELLENKATEG